MQRDQLKQFLDDYLNAALFTDLCPNGLQVEGKEEIKKVVTGVSASVELFRQAIAAGADAILVHHGIIWNFERPLYKGGYRERVRLLLENDLNLFAYHLPLDAHAESGNNAQLAQELGLENRAPFGEYKGQPVGIMGKIAAVAADSFFEKIAEVTNRAPLTFRYGPEKITSVGIITGGAQKDLGQAVQAGLDCYITGEVSEHTMYLAREEGIHFVSAGHYATERFGVLALGELLRSRFGLDVEFIEIDNPV
jgi:dinuclear metal center YbgI/SA1388 family protein